MASPSQPHTHPELIYTPPPSTTAPPALTGSANISIREYIYFLPYPLPKGTPVPYTPGLPDTNPLNLPPHPFEPTSTLVLTSPRKTFVDLRYRKPVATNESPLPNHGERERLEWGFAGTSSSSLAEGGRHEKYGEFGHSTWTHWLDSRYPVEHPNIPVDEGDMYALSPSLFLEHGHAFHPHLDRVAGHEELWRSVGALSTNADGSKVCVVLRYHDVEEGIRGVVIRTGQFCQGILMHGLVATTERWEFDVEGKEEGGVGEETWKRTARTGDLFLPCSVTFRPEVVQLGGRVRYGGFEWVVEEAWEWK
ncbi:hypothetical protein BU25DRAFT_465096 [Macroventuria anomochaeta]|uniref:Uncharacterized protein n=1 Tax=Macroventuria anomochaeta TaxID=301207 RepID=A0ACB6SII2_9PLEO|nr:uncharacterized protein BU25DRAFT_465096 [Macroventuria anomochaeta]KAF2633874.1 hypothetical protein BU25DRAFT_465096 [Macroventuria anomochaeta]